MTQKEKMLAGQLYSPADPELSRLHRRAVKLARQYNMTDEEDEQALRAIARELVPNAAEGLFLQPPVHFDYGCFTWFGKNGYANYNFTVLDCCPVRIGDNVMFGPNCTLATPVHPFWPAERNIRTAPDGSLYDIEYARPITIGNDCWLASNVTVCGGVTIGDGCVIGAGSVLTRDIPPYSFAAGNPCRVIRPITERDRLMHE